MEEYRFDQSDSMGDHVPGTEEVVNVLYEAGEQVVHTEPRETTHTRDQLEELDRSSLYEIGEEEGVDLTWSGENADAKEDMVAKIIDHFGYEE